MSTEDSRPNVPHVVVFPLMAQGHIIPMTDMAKILALHGCRVTMVTTPLNSIRYEAVMEWSRSMGLNMKLQLLPFPSRDYGLPENCENLESSATNEMSCATFIVSTRNLQHPFENFVMKDPPNCIISDAVFPWTLEVAQKLRIPRYSFHVVSCFAWYCYYSMHHKLEGFPSDGEEELIIPGLADQVKMPKTFFREGTNRTSLTRKEVMSLVREALFADIASDGTIFNTSYEMETYYVDQYQSLVGKPVWTIGPVTLINNPSGIFHGAYSAMNNASVDEDQCLRWLDSKPSRSVIYVCFGSITSLSEQQIIELGSGLESSNHSFLWKVRGEINKGFLHDLQERVKDRGFVITGWAPQVLILSHHAVGGFMTHCGWNSTIEGISAGLPLITWPCTFVDQAFVEKLVTDVLKVGVSIGNKHVMGFVGDNEVELVGRDKIERAVNRVLGDGDEEKEMKDRATKLGERVKQSIERGGSSTRNINLILQRIGCKI